MRPVERKVAVFEVAQLLGHRVRLVLTHRGQVCTLKLLNLGPCLLERFLVAPQLLELLAGRWLAEAVRPSQFRVATEREVRAIGQPAGRATGLTTHRRAAIDAQLVSAALTHERMIATGEDECR
jgi:hypothetical protein